MIRLLICGDRRWGITQENNKAVRNEFEILFIRKIIQIIRKLEDIEVIIEGGANGADLYAKEIANNLSIPVIEYCADWRRFPKKAGPIRNRQMLSKGKPDIVIGFHNNLAKSKGTNDMLSLAKSKKIPTACFNIDLDDTNINSIINKLLTELENKRQVKQMHLL